MKIKLLFLAFTALVAVSCQLEPSVDFLRVCNEPDYDKTCPKDMDVFEATETDKIYMSATMSHIPENTDLTITWYYIEDEEMEIDHVNLKTDEEMVDVPVYSYLSQPDNGWPLGKYKVVLDIQLENLEPMEKTFSME